MVMSDEKRCTIDRMSEDIVEYISPCLDKEWECDIHTEPQFW